MSPPSMGSSRPERTPASISGAVSDHQRSARRLLAVVAAVVVVAIGAAGCDTSPYAASVGSSVVRQTALQAELRDWTANPGFVKGFNQANAQSGITIAGNGPGTYSAPFSAFILDQRVDDVVVRQTLDARAEAPSAAALDAARGTLEIYYSTIWQGFSAAFRSYLVTELAQAALLEPTPADTSTLQAAFGGKRQYFFSRVCTREITVSVLGNKGGIDYPASQRKADQTIAQDYNQSPGTTTFPPNVGVITCYTQSQLEDQTPSLFNEVLGLAPGQAAAPRRTSDGYTILAVDSRTEQQFGPATASVLGFEINQDQSQAQGQGLGAYAPVLVRALAAAQVKVNPAFGTWNARQLQVQPSSVPLDVYNKINGTPPGPR